MGRKYNRKYQKGKFRTSEKAKKADFARTAWKNLTDDPEVWKSDTRKYDMPYKDTGADYIRANRGLGSVASFNKKVFKYKFRSKKKLGKKLGRENKHYRRYWR